MQSSRLSARTRPEVSLDLHYRGGRVRLAVDPLEVPRVIDLLPTVQVLPVLVDARLLEEDAGVSFTLFPLLGDVLVLQCVVTLLANAFGPSERRIVIVTRG